MNRSALIIAAALSLAGFAVQPVRAESPDPSGQFAGSAPSHFIRAQSIAQARRNGDLLVPGELGLTERQLYPDRYPANPPVAGRTRAEVRAELEEARRSGDLLLPGDAGITAYEAKPSAYPVHPVLAGKTREQVRADTLQAIRDGDILASGEAGVTLRQLYPHTYLARGRGEAPQNIAARPGSQPQ